MTANTGPMYTLTNGWPLVPLPVRYTIGVNLGKHADYTALAIAEERPERVIEQRGQATISPVWSEDPDFTIPWLQRWPLETPYFTIATEVGKLVAALEARPRPRCKSTSTAPASAPQWSRSSAPTRRSSSCRRASRR